MSRAIIAAKRRGWTEFLGRPATAVDETLAMDAVRDQSVLITGAGGSVGSGLARAVLKGLPARVVLLELSETALYESYRELSQLSNEVIPVIGSVTDAKFLAYLFRSYRPDLVLHAAAYKHVPLMERNPFSAIANNSIGSYRLAITAAEAGVGRLIAISTDKAVRPQSVMGASKRIAELAVLAHASSDVRMNVVRLCNVLGSAGSVAPIFEEQARLGLPLTVTDTNAERYFLTPAEAEVAILQAAACSAWGRTLLPDCGEAFRIVDLARYIAGREGEGSSIAIIGARPGDKVREELLAREESIEAELAGGMRVVRGPVPSAREIAAGIECLEAAIAGFHYAELMAAVRELVPEYRPAGATNVDAGREGK